jgi:predicted TIM-barrel fold metal-dependent hydrolase
MELIMKKEFEMSKEELKELLEACRPVPAMFLSGGILMFGTPQENAKRAWQRLGEKKGFDYMSVQPVSGKGQRFFTAVPIEKAA